MNKGTTEPFFTDRLIDEKGENEPEPVKSSPPLSFSNIADQAFVGTWEFLNSATYGLTSLALSTSLGDNSLYKDFEKNLQQKVADHPFIAEVGSFAGSIVPFVVPEEGLLFTALRLPAITAEKASEAFTASAIARNLLSPTTRRYFNASLTGAVYGGFGGLTSGLDIAYLDNDGVDAITNGAMTALSGAVFGGALGPAVELVGDTFSYLKRKSFGIVETNLNVPDLSAQGLEKLFQLAQSETKNTQNQSILKENSDILKKAIDIVNKYADDVQKEAIPEFKNANLLLDLTLGQPDFAAKILSSEKPFALKDLSQSSNFVEDLKIKIGKELAIDPEKVSVRENLTKIISTNLREAGAISDSLLETGTPILNDYLSQFSEMPVTNPSLQRSQVLDIYTNILGFLEGYNEKDQVIDRALKSGFLSSKESFDSLSKKNKKSFLKNYLNIESPEKTQSVLSEYLKKTQSGLNALRTILNPKATNTFDQNQLYQNLLSSIDVLNNNYQIAQETIGKEFTMPKELTRLHTEIRSQLRQISSNEALWGKGAVLREKLYNARNAKLQIKRDLDSLLNINAKKRDIPGLLYDENGFAVSKPRLKTALPLKNLNKFKTAGMANANLGVGDLLPEYTIGYLNNVQKEFEVISEVLDTHEQALKSNLLTSKDKKTIKRNLKSLQKSKLELQQRQKELSLKKQNIDTTTQDLRRFNDYRVQNWFNATESLAKVAQQEKKTSLDFELHTGGPSPQIETIRLLRDAAVGYTAGVERSISWLLLSGIGKGVKYAVKEHFGDISPEETFLRKKQDFLQKRQTLSKISRSRKISPSVKSNSNKYSKILKNAGILHFSSDYNREEGE